MQPRKIFCEIYGEECLNEHQCQRWFSRFRFGNFDALHTGRAITTDEHKIKA